MSNTKYFADLIKVCSVLPVFAVVPAMAETINIGTGGSYTLTGKYIDTVTNDGSVYFLQSTDKQQLAVLNVENAIVSNITMNEANGQSGVIKGYDNSKVVVRNSEFSDNKAPYYAAIWTVAPWQDIDGGILDVSGSKFLRNKTQDGGAIGAMWKTKISDSLFEGNETAGDGGGAILLGAVSQSVLTDVIFKNNSSETVGGAIAMRSATQGNNSQAKLDIFDSEFTGNTAATNGGAIYSTFYDSETVKDSVYIYDTDFSLNSAQRGGAIYTEGLADLGGGFASMKIVDADFEGNTATAEGGAIWNGSNLVIVDSDFIGNTSTDAGGAIHNEGNLTLQNVNFENNSVSNWEGGALYVTGGGTTNIIGGEFKNNHADVDVGGAITLKSGTVNIDGTRFVGNTALYSGAIFTYSSGNTLNVKNSVFDSNVALDSGAVQAMYNASFTNTKFTNNVATLDSDDSDGAGALFIGAVGKAVLDNVTFDNNRTNYRGGAISTRSADLGNNKDAKLDVLNSKFIGNKAATTGGAFDNYLYSSVADDAAVYFENVEFSANSAALGGAVYNHGAEDCGGNTASTHINGATFTGNIATDAGGAIYNEANGALMLSGTNTFTGNTANGVANDIYNDGVLTIALGTTTFDGGITGTGTLDVQEGATLNAGYAAINQTTVNVNGTLGTSLLNASDAGRINAQLTGAGTIALNVGATGVYDISKFDGFTVDFGKTYDVAIEAGKATVSAKDAQTIASETGVSVGAAGAVSGLASSSDVTLQQVSLRAQEALNSGDVALVEKEMAKANPDTKPVSQSVAASVQNQVVTMAAGRMSTIGSGATGRAGGDVTGAGVWAQGMFNKSKFADKFHGYTRGFAIGGDTLIDNVLTIGGGYAFSNTDVHADGRNMDVENNSIFVYAQYKPAAWYVNATLNYTKSDYADASTIFGYLLNDDYETKSYGAQAMFGYDFASGVTPEFGMRYLHVSQEDHVDVMNREIAGVDTDFLSGVAGVKYAFAIESDTAIKFSPTMRAAMTYDFLSDDATATVVVPGAAAYYVDVDRLSRLGGEFGIGLTAEYRGLELSLNYELDLHQDYTSQTGLFKFRYDF